MSAEFATPLQKDIAAAVRLMVHPTAPVAALSAFGFGLAAHAFGIWAGTVVGAAQASQRLFAPFDSNESGSAVQPAKRPAAEVVAMPERSKPALKVVPKAEPAASSSAAEPAKAVEPVVKTAPDAEPAAVKATEVAKAVVAKPVSARTSGPAKKKAAEPAKPVAKPVKAEAALSPGEPRKPRAIDRPAVPDDLKAIAGIGPKLETVLNDLGVWTYAQIAAWDRQEIAWVDDYLSFKGRIDRDGWIAQAAALAGGTKAEV